MLQRFFGWILYWTGNKKKTFSLNQGSRVQLLQRCVTICPAYYRNHYIPICNGVHWWKYNEPVTHKMAFTLKDKLSSCVITLLTDTPQICDRENDRIAHMPTDRQWKHNLQYFISCKGWSTIGYFSTLYWQHWYKWMHHKVVHSEKAHVHPIQFLYKSQLHLNVNKSKGG